MAMREMQGMHRGALLGVAWLVLRPLIQVTFFVVIIAYVFRVQLGEGVGTFDYTLYVLSGLIVWQSLQRALEEAPSLVRDRMEFLKQTVYPLETLPLTGLVINALSPAAGFAVYLVLAIVNGSFAWTILLLPIPVALLIAFVMGMSWMMMIVGVMVKDLREIVSVILALLIYVSPVLISEKMVTPFVWDLLLLNPLAHIIICFRDVLFGAFHSISWIIFSAMTFFSLLIGAWVVHRMKLYINEYL